MKLKSGKAISPSELGLLSVCRQGRQRQRPESPACSPGSQGRGGVGRRLRDRSLDVQAQPDLLDRIQEEEGSHRHREEELGRERRAAEEALQAEGSPRRGRAGCAVRTGCRRGQAAVGRHGGQAQGDRGQPQGIHVGDPSWDTRRIMPISDVVVHALEQAGKKEKAGKLYAKIKSGQPLEAGELKEARQIANLIGRMKIVHGDLVSESEETLAMHGAFIGACVMGGIGAAQEQNDSHGKFAEDMGRKIASGQALTPAERNAAGQGPVRAGPDPQVHCQPGVGPSLRGLPTGEDVDQGSVRGGDESHERAGQEDAVDHREARQDRQPSRPESARLPEEVRRNHGRGMSSARASCKRHSTTPPPRSSSPGDESGWSHQALEMGQEEEPVGERRAGWPR